MTRVDTIAEAELEPFMLPSIDTVAAVGSDATQETNCHADSCIRRQFSIKRKVCGSELLTSSLTKCFFLFLFILAACGHTPLVLQLPGRFSPGPKFKLRRGRRQRGCIATAKKMTSTHASMASTIALSMEGQVHGIEHGIKHGIKCGIKHGIERRIERGIEHGIEHGMST